MPATSISEDDSFCWDGLPAEIRNMITEIHVMQGSQERGLPAFTAVNKALRSHALALFFKNHTLEMQTYIQHEGKILVNKDSTARKYKPIKELTYSVSTRIYNNTFPWSHYGVSKYRETPDFRHLTMLEMIPSLEIYISHDLPPNHPDVAWADNYCGIVNIYFPYHSPEDMVIDPFGADDQYISRLDIEIKTKLSALAETSNNSVVLSIELLETLLAMIYRFQRRFWRSRIKDGSIREQAMISDYARWYTEEDIAAGESDGESDGDDDGDDDDEDEDDSRDQGQGQEI